MLVLTVGFIVFTIDFLYFHSIVSGEQRRAGWRRGTGVHIFGGGSRWHWGWVRWGHGLNLYSWVVGLLVSGGRVAEKYTHRSSARNLDTFKHPLFSKIVTGHW